ncbi:MAG: phosphohistidine phosphatase, SixA [Chloroflexi bacterium]|nr:phosphohistidine phosphatase, SixA [Chloroflexota bacterium]
MTNHPGLVRLHLLRHADAGDPEAWDGPDETRPLSPRGERQAERLATLLLNGGFVPDAILSSPRVRARETAEIVAATLHGQVRLDPRLAGPLELETVEAILADAGDPVRPILVGHDPEFSALASELTGAPRLLLRKGSLARIDAERPMEPGEGILRWLVPPDLLRP